MSIFQWKPLTPQEILLLTTIIVALFGERIWRFFDKRNKKIKIKQILLIPLERLEHDLLRIRDERNARDKSRPDSTKIIFNQTSFDEINNHFFLFTDVVIPYIDTINLPKESKTIDFFTHYNKNIETLKSRLDSQGNGSLTLGTVNKLLEKLNLSIEELK